MLTFLCLMVMMICYLSGMWIYCSKRKHLLIISLSLEYMFFLLFYIGLLIGDNTMWIIFIYNSFSVCGLWSVFSFSYFSFYSTFSW